MGSASVLRQGGQWKMGAGSGADHPACRGIRVSLGRRGPGCREDAECEAAGSGRGGQRAGGGAPRGAAGRLRWAGFGWQSGEPAGCGKG